MLKFQNIFVCYVRKKDHYQSWKVPKIQKAFFFLKPECKIFSRFCRVFVVPSNYSLQFIDVSIKFIIYENGNLYDFRWKTRASFDLSYFTWRLSFASHLKLVRQFPLELKHTHLKYCGPQRILVDSFYFGSITWLINAVFQT